MHMFQMLNFRRNEKRIKVSHILSTQFLSIICLKVLNLSISNTKNDVQVKIEESLVQWVIQ